MTDVIVIGAMCALPVGALIFLYVDGVRRDRREAAFAVLLAKFNALDAEFAMKNAVIDRDMQRAMRCTDGEEQAKILSDVIERSIASAEAHRKAMDAI